MSRLPSGIRRIGTRLLGSVPVRIQSGPNVGCRWSLASAGRGYRSGTFEADRVHAIVSLLRAGNRFWDVGAHKGYLTLAAARTIGPGGQVVALEPSAANQLLLRRHVHWSGLENIQVLPVALSDVDGEARFGGSGSSITFQLGRGNEIVPTRTVGSLIEDDRLPAPDVIKIDAEGSEAAILRGALRHLSPHMLIWISIHSRTLYQECRTLLGSRSFCLFESAGMARVTRTPRAPWGGDKELLAVGADHDLREADVRALPLFHA